MTAINAPAKDVKILLKDEKIATLYTSIKNLK
jgi:hypothetical protein